MTTLSGKKVLLTGATGTIGYATAQALVKHGAIVAGVDLSQSKLDSAATQINSSQNSFYGFKFDLQKISELSLLVDSITRKIGQVDILVNNAGIDIYSEYRKYSSNDIQKILGINLIASMELARLLLPGMLQRNSGHIANVTSLLGRKGCPYSSVYSASKAGLIAWSDALRQELVLTDVQVSSVFPGYVSDGGITADTGIPVPKLAGHSKSSQVAKGISRAIQGNYPEILINQNLPTELLTKFIYSLFLLSPRLGDFIYTFIGLPQANRKRSK